MGGGVAAGLRVPDAEREGDSEPEAQGVAEGHTVELAVGHTVKQPDVEGVALVVAMRWEGGAVGGGYSEVQPRTSSSEVTPRRTLCRPDRRRLRTPSRSH